MVKFGSFVEICQTASLIVCPLLRNPANANIQGIEPGCYSRNIEIGGTLLFQPAASFVHVAAIIMTLIMILHVRSKYTAIGRKEIVLFFWLYILTSLMAFFLDAGIAPSSHVSYPWVAAAYSGTITATYTALLINGFVGFQFVEDGTNTSLWSLRLTCLFFFGASFFVAVATFKSIAGFSPTKPLALWIVYILYPVVCVAVYTVMQLVLVFRTLEDRWPVGDILFGAAFFGLAQVVLHAFSIRICASIEHYFDGVCVSEAFILLSVMMVYKYWDSITKEDLEFSVGNKATVWEVKDPLLNDPPPQDYYPPQSYNHHQQTLWQSQPQGGQGRHRGPSRRGGGGGSGGVRFPPGQ